MRPNERMRVKSFLHRRRLPYEVLKLYAYGVD
jgi:hypothetical protein